MAKNISLLGANYPDVPAVVLPQTGGGTARFTDVSDTTAKSGDVLSGKSFFDASGVEQQGSLITHNVYDGLDSSSTTDALSANQGKVLNSKLALLSESLINNQLRIERIGNLRILRSIGNGMTLPISDAIIPAEDRPRAVVQVPCATQSNTDLYWIQINTNGTLSFFKGGSAVTTTTNYMLFEATWGV